MKTSVKQLSDTKVELTISIGEKELKDAELVALTKVAKKVKAPGFRAGKVPPSVAAKYADPTILAEQILDDALSAAVSTAFVEQKISALDRPQVEIKKYVPGSELEFTAETEVIPEVKLGDFKKLGVKKKVAPVAASDIDDVIERMRKGFAERKDTDKPAKDGDEAIMDFVGKNDGVAFDGGTADDYTLVLGSKQFIPGFEEGVIGHKAGEQFDIEVTFPEDYHSKALAGKPVVFSINLKKVNQVVLPKLDEAFAKKAGPFNTVAELKKDINRELEANKDREADDKFKDELISKLIEVSTIPAPEILVNDQSRSIEQDMVQNLMYQGLTLESYLESKNLTKEEWLATEVKDAAVNRVKAGLGLSELSKQLNVTATNEELAEKINQYQEQFGNKSGQDFTTPELQRDIANRLLTDKTIDELVKINS